MKIRTAVLGSFGTALLMVASVGTIQVANADKAADDNHGLELLLPSMDPARGRHLFASKGCVVCHSVNGVGGTDAPKLDWSTMKGPMNPFDFAARMWHGAPAMIAMQQHELGAQIKLTGQELADIIAFAHDPEEQAKFSEKDIPAKIKKLMEGD